MAVKLGPISAYVFFVSLFFILLSGNKSLGEYWQAPKGTVNFADGQNKFNLQYPV